MSGRMMTCQQLDEWLGDYLDKALDDSRAAEIELHLSGCPSCAAMVRDFEEITRTAATLPALTPSRDLWTGIEARISAPVVDLAARARAQAESRSGTRRATWHRVRTGAIAAGLMGITAVVTWSVARRDPGAAVASAPAGGIASPSNGDSSLVASPERETPRQRTDDPAAPPAAPVGGAVEEGPRAILTSRRPAVSPQVTFDSEISVLRGALRERRDELDPRTVAVIESSIATIDSAIAQARSALRRDPASRFLSEQLNKALEKKLGLLRTAALLPART